MTPTAFLDQMLSGKRISEDDHAALRGLIAAEANLLEPTNASKIGFTTCCQSRLKAASKLFDTAELLETILLLVPQPSLPFSVRRVCKALKTAIDTMPAIQQWLFSHYDPHATTQAPVLLPYPIPGLDKHQLRPSILRCTVIDFRTFNTIAQGAPGRHSQLLGAQLVFPPLRNMHVSGSYRGADGMECHRLQDYDMKAEADADGVTLGQWYGALERFLEGIRVQKGSDWRGHWQLNVSGIFEHA
ncbi:hypothetical protein EJ03DRAFT_176946 [Teratosphaeria nubilosa]|uniref:F-box domain-containing protein n=1 Tax=Teratosphaeria nubilosa TaxID=161662 RepID=A0A6G1L0V4_9PEZI|nr:hypothetical protein EJ03DRAFT_176946 [Teratosphaeria nubilosa]